MKKLLLCELTDSEWKAFVAKARVAEPEDEPDAVWIATLEKFVDHVRRRSTIDQGRHAPGNVSEALARLDDTGDLPDLLPPGPVNWGWIEDDADGEEGSLPV